MTAVTGTSPF